MPQMVGLALHVGLPRPSSSNYINWKLVFQIKEFVMSMSGTLKVG